MPETWPASVPATPLREGYERQGGNNVIRSRNDRGKVKQRRRFTTAVDTVSASFRWTDAQFDTFMTWLGDTLGDGALSFTWTEPVTGTSYEARIPNGRAAVTSKPGPGANVTVSFPIELLA